MENEPTHTAAEGAVGTFLADHAVRLVDDLRGSLSKALMRARDVSKVAIAKPPKPAPLASIADPVERLAEKEARAEKRRKTRICNAWGDIAACETKEELEQSAENMLKIAEKLKPGQTPVDGGFGGLDILPKWGPETDTPKSGKDAH